MRKIWMGLEENKAMFNEAARSGALIVFDTETTGLHPENGDQIVEFAAMKCVYDPQKGFVSIEDIDLFICPDKPISKEASDVNGITMDMLEDKPHESEAYLTIKRFFGDHPVTAAYNSRFDIQMLNAMYQRNGDTFEPKLDIDVLKVAKDVFCEVKLQNHKLITIADTYGVTEGIKFHSAIDDVRVLVRVINKLIEDITENEVREKRAPVSLYRLRYWPGYKGHAYLYCDTSAGEICYDFAGSRWGSRKDLVDLQELDMQSLENQMFAKSGRYDYRTLRNDLASGRLKL